MIKAIVVFATITGNNEKCADVIIDELQRMNVEVSKAEMSQTDAYSLNNYDIIIIVPYTYDKGNIPEEGLDFFRDLHNQNLKNKIYGVAGSGDLFYEENYNVAVNKFSNELKNAGAILGSPELKIDLYPDHDDIHNLKKLTKNIVNFHEKYK